MFSFFTSKQQPTVEQIHAEFDNAQDRLLQQAQEIVNGYNSNASIEVKERAMRLKRLGFENVPTVKKAIRLNEEEQVVVKSKEQANLILNYKVSYPFQKFLTVEELDRICNKYGLIYAPVQNYIKEVPEKNLREIESAPSLKTSDESKSFYTVKVTKFWYDVPSEIQNLLKGEVVYTSDRIRHDSEPTEDGLRDTLIKLGYKGDYKGYLFHKAICKKVDHSGLFIAAPSSHFNLKGLSKETKFGFMRVEKREIKDPIVFRYCKGGIQVLSKWGLEGEDELLLNEINN